MIIKSKINPELILCNFYSSFDVKNDSPCVRVDLSVASEPLQVCVLNLINVSFKAHSHLKKNVGEIQIQECWVVMEGSAVVDVHDIDSSYVITCNLIQGDVFVTYNGGHALRASNAKIIEIKNGPYEGRELDYKCIEPIV